ncbi:PREDICTED: protein THEM6-like isoform X1 [Gekko japonicus]|uniref:Protein THEM6 n=1 Tax=Gekko japonicus TaxID=146911 RepID=A0ABM1K7D1_GEKJA|nr:PREDICTED: protein THEM6-like isoform X1 [Gekko japonicus]
MIWLLSSFLCVTFLLLLCFSDIWFFMRIGFLYSYACFWQTLPEDIFETLVLRNLVLTSDLDYTLHMNNARYLREADIARCVIFARYRLVRALNVLKAATVLSASCSRFRRPLSLFERFSIHTRILGWDDHAFYLEQKFVTCQKNFVAAVIHCRHHVTGTTPVALVELIMRKKVESPELPEEVKHWLKYNEANSQRLRAESNNQKNEKEQ